MQFAQFNWPKSDKLSAKLIRNGTLLEFSTNKIFSFNNQWNHLFVAAFIVYMSVYEYNSQARWIEIFNIDSLV